MSSSSPKKVFFTGFKKEQPVPPQPSPASEVRPATERLNRLAKFGFKFLFALNLGLYAYILLTGPPKRRRDTGATVINDATRSDPETLPQSQNTMQSPANV